MLAMKTTQPFAQCVTPYAADCIVQSIILFLCYCILSTDTYSLSLSRCTTSVSMCYI